MRRRTLLALSFVAGVTATANADDIVWRMRCPTKESSYIGRAFDTSTQCDEARGQKMEELTSPCVDGIRERVGKAYPVELTADDMAQAANVKACLAYVFLKMKCQCEPERVK